MKPQYTQFSRQDLTLTYSEIRLLQASRTNEFGDAFEKIYPWVFAVVKGSGLPLEAAIEAISSLQQKGLVCIETYDEDGGDESSDSSDIFVVTDLCISTYKKFIAPNGTVDPAIHAIGNASAIANTTTTGNANVIENLTRIPKHCQSRGDRKSDRKLQNEAEGTNSTSNTDWTISPIFFGFDSAESSAPRPIFGSITDYNKFLLAYSSDGYEVHKNEERRQTVFLYGLSEEWGEFQGILKRIERGDGGSIINTQIPNKGDLKLELGDFLAYLVLLGDTITFESERLTFRRILNEAIEKQVSYQLPLVCKYPLGKQLKVVSLKLTRHLGALASFYEDIELELADPNSEETAQQLLTCLAKLVVHIAFLAHLLGTNLAEIASLNYAKLYLRENAGTQYGKGSYR